MGVGEKVIPSILKNNLKRSNENGKNKIQNDRLLNKAKNRSITKVRERSEQMSKEDANVSIEDEPMSREDKTGMRKDEKEAKENAARKAETNEAFEVCSEPAGLDAEEEILESLEEKQKRVKSATERAEFDPLQVL